jgi:hypothetical protein
MIPSISPKCDKDGLTSGRECFGIESSFKISSDHYILYKSYKRVLEAFVTSV